MTGCSRLFGPAHAPGSGRRREPRIDGGGRIGAESRRSASAGSHVVAIVNLGNDRKLLLDVITVLLPFIGYPCTLNALGVINEVTST
jgi:hypothetical protein